MELKMKNLVVDLKNKVITLDDLRDDYFIKVKEYDDRIVLNYDQIQSPKSDDYVVQCRGLILDKQFNVLCLPFDRFFNMGEVYDHNANIDWSNAECFEKVDGSLIKIYHDGEAWCCATRGTAFAETDVYGWDIIFADLVYNALGVVNSGEFDQLCSNHLNIENTYLCEVTARENRVVTAYDGYKLWNLAIRNTENGEYISDKQDCLDMGMLLPSVYSFESVESCIHTAANLPDLQEGYVLYVNGKPYCKIKSPSYVAIHHIRGEGLNPKRISELVMMNEVDEYLKYFPDDAEYFVKYEYALENLIGKIKATHQSVVDITDQKEFAMMVKDYPFSAILFNWKKKGGCPIDILHNQPINFKTRLLDQYVA